MARSSAQTQQLVILGIVSAVAASLLLWKLSSTSRQQQRGLKNRDDVDDSDDDTAPTLPSTVEQSLPRSPTKATTEQSKDADKTPKRTNKTLSSADMNTKIEDLDKKGKSFFKDKQVRYPSARTFAMHCCTFAHDSSTLSFANNL